MKTITVSYFAVFREQAGCEQEQVETASTSAADLFAECREQHPKLVRFDAMKFAVNDRLTDGDAELADGDRVLFFPPVAGG